MNSFYEDAVMADAPYVLYPMAEAVGAVALDVSGNDLHGEIVGGPALATREVYGHTCADFDGANDYYQTPPFNTAGWPGLTIEALILVDVVGNGTGVISNEYEGSGTRVTLEMGWSVASSSGSAWTVARYSGSSWGGTPNIGNPVTVGAHHVAASITADGLINVFVDGLLLTQQSHSFVVDDDRWFFGRRHDTAGARPFFDGAMAFGAIYQGALSEERIAAHYEAALRDERQRTFWQGSNAPVTY